MRLIGTILHPGMRISVFHMNGKYIVKLEAGPMEQVFKFSEEEVKGLEDLRQVLDEPFLQKAIARFNEMFADLKAARENFEKKDRMA